MVRAVVEFAAAAALIVLLPGPDTFVVIRNLLRGGRRRAALTAGGVLSGLAVWVAAAALGLSALLRASHTGYDVLRFTGAAYLLWVGIHSIVARAGGVSGDPSALRARPLLGSGYLSGLATDLLNPKVGVFFISFLPAFVPRGADVGAATGAFGAVFIAETLLYFVVLVAIADRVVRLLGDARKRRLLDRAAGLVFVGFGVRLATESA